MHVHRGGPISERIRSEDLLPIDRRASSAPRAVTTAWPSDRRFSLSRVRRLFRSSGTSFFATATVRPESNSSTRRSFVPASNAKPARSRASRGRMAPGVDSALWGIHPTRRTGAILAIHHDGTEEPLSEGARRAWHPRPSGEHHEAGSSMRGERRQGRTRGRRPGHNLAPVVRLAEGRSGPSSAQAPRTRMETSRSHPLVPPWRGPLEARREGTPPSTTTFRQWGYTPW